MLWALGTSDTSAVCLSLPVPSMQHRDAPWFQLEVLRSLTPFLSSCSPATNGIFKSQPKFPRGPRLVEGWERGGEASNLREAREGPAHINFWSRGPSRHQTNCLFASGLQVEFRAEVKPSLRRVPFRNLAISSIRAAAEHSVSKPFFLRLVYAQVGWHSCAASLAPLRSFPTCLRLSDSGAAPIAASLPVTAAPETLAHIKTRPARWDATLLPARRLSPNATLLVCRRRQQAAPLNSKGRSMPCAATVPR